MPDCIQAHLKCEVQITGACSLNARQFSEIPRQEHQGVHVWQALLHHSLIAVVLQLPSVCALITLEGRFKKINSLRRPLRRALAQFLWADTIALNTVRAISLQSSRPIQLDYSFLITPSSRSLRCDMLARFSHIQSLSRHGSRTVRFLCRLLAHHQLQHQLDRKSCPSSRD